MLEQRATTKYITTYDTALISNCCTHFCLQMIVWAAGEGSGRLLWQETQLVKQIRARCDSDPVLPKDQEITEKWWKQCSFWIYCFHQGESQTYNIYPETFVPCLMSCSVRFSEVYTSMYRHCRREDHWECGQQSSKLSQTQARLVPSPPYSNMNRTKGTRIACLRHHRVSVYKMCESAQWKTQMT